MVRYEYRCPGCGPWDVALPMGAAGPVLTCPRCGLRSPRQWSAPAPKRMSRKVAGLRLREEGSRDVPEVTASVPAKAVRRRRADPRQANLPRP